MILLDTNVISESLKFAGDARVLAWLDAQLIESLYVSTISLPLFHGRILPFDEAASETYGVLRAQARAQGKAIATADGYIAATAIHHGLMVATRDTAPFEAAGLKVINPWDSPQ